MKWRNIGPYRGGRSVTAVGVPTQPYTYYFGATGGGVWKTTDAGDTWTNVSDGQIRTGSVGAVAVAESDPNVVYAGMGEHAVRGVMTSHGDGVYRSTDAGETWAHLGLDQTRQISAVRVHPDDPDLVYVAAQGSPYNSNEERGIFRSKDGGTSWEKILYVDANSGASDLSMDMTNPRILYAGFWDHRRYPWTVRSGGPGSALYKSTDGGDTWSELTNGLPAEMGKTAISVSRADPKRVWALVEADSGGLYRSDDAGNSWRRVNSERELIARAWYYIEVFADPQDPETVWVLNAPALKSVDGGKTFARVPTPHGDNHDLWINPLDTRYLINANDGGANVSLNGGKSWSTQQNQPTAQFYRVDVDDRFPYYLYGGQQDNSSVAIASRTTGAGIDWKDWYAVAGCESAHLAFDPADPKLVYGGCYQGQIEEYDHATRQNRSIMAYPFLGLGTTPRDQKFRFNWNAPIETSPHDRSVLYHAGNVLLRSDDRGRSWAAISPDLTRNDPEKQGIGGYPFTNEGAGGEVYNTIMYIVESPHTAGTIWAGTDDGLIHITQDGGGNWTNVTPRGLEESQINAIEVSPHAPSTAYAAVTRYKFNDFTPLVYKTTDFGRSWSKITRGIPADEFVRVVREDPVRPDLLYAGTELGVHVSFDGGQQWRPLASNLPVVPITDLAVKGADLIAATQGRSFWILDDLTPLRQAEGPLRSWDTRLFRPQPAVRMEGSTGSGTVGKNPPSGAILYYSLAAAPEEPITLDIVGTSGNVVRSYTSAETDSVITPSGNFAPARLPAKPGLNRFVWDLRHEEIPRLPGVFVNGGLQGRRAVPGEYRVRLTVDAREMTEPLAVVADPRYEAPRSAYAEQEQMLEPLDAAVAEMHRSAIELQAIRAQIEALLGRPNAGTPENVRVAGDSLASRITALEDRLIQTRQETFQDVINFPNQLNSNLLYLKEAIDSAEPFPTQGAKERLNDLLAEWRARQAELDAMLSSEVARFNTLVRESGVPAVGVVGR